MPARGGLVWNLRDRVRRLPRRDLDLNCELDTATAAVRQWQPTRSTSSSVDYPWQCHREVGQGSGSTTLARASRLREQPGPGDPELIRARLSDAHSGVAAAKMFYRAVGVRRRMAAAARRGSARRGDGPRSTRRAAPLASTSSGSWSGTSPGTRWRPRCARTGRRCGSRFPLRAAGGAASTTSARGGSAGQIVPYGTRSEVRGRLLDAAGDPLAGQEIVVVDRFDNGALFPRAERPAVTDEQGRFQHPRAGRSDALDRGHASPAPTDTCRPRTRSAGSRSRARPVPDLGRRGPGGRDAGHRSPARSSIAAPGSPPAASWSRSSTGSRPGGSAR